MAEPGAVGSGTARSGATKLCAGRFLTELGIARSGVAKRFWRRRQLTPLTTSSRSGFTLIEILVSIVILSVGILGVTAMQSASLKGGISARAMDSAISIAFDSLDRLQTNSENLSDYMSGGGTFTVSPEDDDDEYSSNNGERPTSDTAGNDYDALYDQMVDMHLSNATLDVTILTDTPVTGVSTATAVVSWTHKGSQKQCQATLVIIRD